VTTFDLDGLAANNPLAFMAALGTLVVADRAWPGGQVRLAWSNREGAWRPRLRMPTKDSREELIKVLHAGVHRAPKTDDKKKLQELDEKIRASKKGLKVAGETFKNLLKAKTFKKDSPEAAAFLATEVTPLEAQLSEAQLARVIIAEDGAAPDITTSLGRNLKIPAPLLAKLARKAALDASPTDRRAVDFFAAFGCEALVEKDGTLMTTSFAKHNGSSNKHMLKEIGMLMESVSTRQLEESLFEAWRYQDDKRSLGWDPCDVRPYAHQAEDPEASSVTMHGANLLAYEALTLFPAVPHGRCLVTTGTTEFKVDETARSRSFFTWPIWEPFLTLAVVRSLVAHRALAVLAPDRKFLRAIGVVEAYRSEHITVNGKSPQFLATQPA
jgi:hypothetical protein